jgi:hypothetical protein
MLRGWMAGLISEHAPRCSYCAHAQQRALYRYIENVVMGLGTRLGIYTNVDSEAQYNTL